MVIRYETYRLRTSESMGSHNSKWREEQQSILNHTYCVRVLINYECNLLAEHKRMYAGVHTAASRENNHSFLITYLVRIQI